MYVHELIAVAILASKLVGAWDVTIGVCALDSIEMKCNVQHLPFR